MRLLKRNTRFIYYANYLGREPILDARGYDTGEVRAIYSEPVKITANISPAVGSSSVELFGNSVNYERVITLCDPDCPIDEQTVLFIDRPPSFRDGMPIFDYIVKRVARSVNSISVAVSRVEVS